MQAWSQTVRPLRVLWRLSEQIICGCQTLGDHTGLTHALAHAHTYAHTHPRTRLYTHAHTHRQPCNHRLREVRQGVQPLRRSCTSMCHMHLQKAAAGPHDTFAQRWQPPVRAAPHASVFPQSRAARPSWRVQCFVISEERMPLGMRGHARGGQHCPCSACM